MAKEQAIQLRKNTRVDYMTFNNSVHSLLIDFVNDSTLFVKRGRYELKDMYSEYKYRKIQGLSIDLY